MRFYSEILWGRQDQKESKARLDRKVNKEFQEKTALLEQKENRDPLAAGEKGATGSTGPTGPKGDTGPPGAQGPKGDTGAAGKDGADGKSAYEVAVENGYVGTELQWLISLKGETGPQGERGPQGVAGPKGDKGDTGERGATGPAGAKGAKGETGPKGVSIRLKNAWASGVAYVNDSAYIDIVTYNGSMYACKASHTSSSSVTPANTTYWILMASKGDKGDMGERGPQGIQGLKGDTGATGPKGETGAQGPAGAKGATGAAGPKGADGTTPTMAAMEIGILGAPTPENLHVAQQALLVPKGFKVLKVTLGHAVRPEPLDHKAQLVQQVPQQKCRQTTQAATL